MPLGTEVGLGPGHIVTFTERVCSVVIAGKVGRSPSPSLSVYATLRTPRSTSTTSVSVTSPTSTSTINSTSATTSSRLYSPSLTAGLPRRFQAAASSPRSVTATRDAPGRRLPSTYDQRRSTNAAMSKHSTVFQSPGHDVDF